MVSKTATGIDFFDNAYGGVFRGRPFLVCGRAGSGKTVAALQFLFHGANKDERGLILSAWRAKDLVIFANALGFPAQERISSGLLTVLEYSHYVPGRDSEDNLSLPPDGFMQLQDIIEANAIQRVALDTILPWVALRNQEAVAEHALSLVRAFERMGLTAMFTIPKPASPAAFRLRNRIEDLVPVSIMIQKDEAPLRRSWVVTKYIGENRLDAGVNMEIRPGAGIVAADASAPAPAPSVPVAPVPPGPEPAARPETGPAAVPPRRTGIRFSDVLKIKP